MKWIIPTKSGSLYYLTYDELDQLIGKCADMKGCIGLSVSIASVSENLKSNNGISNRLDGSFYKPLGYSMVVTNHEHDLTLVSKYAVHEPNKEVDDSTNEGGCNADVDLADRMYFTTNSSKCGRVKTSIRMAKNISEYMDVPYQLVYAESPDIKNTSKVTKSMTKLLDTNCKRLKDQLNLHPKNVSLTIGGGLICSYRSSVVDRLAELIKQHGSENKQTCPIVSDYLISGLNIGESISTSYKVLEATLTRMAEKLPVKPMTLSNVLGSYEQICIAAKLGISCIDCRLPFLMASCGLALRLPTEKEVSDEICLGINETDSFEGTIATPFDDLRLPEFQMNFDPLPQDMDEFTLYSSDMLSFPTHAYVHHLLNTREMTGVHILVLHNVYIYMRFIGRLNRHIDTNTLDEFIKSISDRTVRLAQHLLMDPPVSYSNVEGSRVGQLSVAEVVEL